MSTRKQPIAAGQAEDFLGCYCSIAASGQEQKLKLFTNSRHIEFALAEKTVQSTKVNMPINDPKNSSRQSFVVEFFSEMIGSAVFYAVLYVFSAIFFWLISRSWADWLFITAGLGLMVVLPVCFHIYSKMPKSRGQKEIGKTLESDKQRIHEEVADAIQFGPIADVADNSKKHEGSDIVGNQWKHPRK